VHSASVLPKLITSQPGLPGIIGSWVASPSSP
jgi:hypothetical protein